MKVYLDDLRTTPEGWVRAYWPHEAIDLLSTGEVTHLSLDHDLGEEGPTARTGYDVVVWLEEQVAVHGFVPPTYMAVHSDNGPGIQRMRQGIEAIRRFHARNTGTL